MTNMSDQTPAQRLTLRLEKLESDLQLLTGMQTLLLSATSRPTNRHDLSDLPERDSSSSPKALKAFKSREAKSNRNRSVAAANITPSSDKVSKSTETDEWDGNLECSEAVKEERKRRMDSDESARQANRKLIQIEEELSKERETKQMLLVGTLQLKNQISSNENHIRQCEAQIHKLEADSQSLRQNVEELNGQKIAITQKFKDLIETLKAQKKLLQADNAKLLLELKRVNAELAEKKQQVSLMEQSLQSMEQKQVTKINQMAARCAQVDKERQDLAVQLRDALDKYETTAKSLEDYKAELLSAKTEAERSSMLQDCVMEKLKSDLTLQKDQFRSQIKNSQEVISKTKQLIAQVRQERDELKVLLKKCEESNANFRKKSEDAIRSYQQLSDHYESFKEKIKVTLTASHENVRKLKQENSNLKALFAQLKKDKAAHVQCAATREAELVRDKTKLEDMVKSMENENTSLRSELTRCTDNFRILQKISEDQVHTIQNLKCEREDQRKLKFQLESQLRDRDATEAALARKLETEQRRNAHLEEDVQEHQKRLTTLEEEIRDHNCEDSVQSDLHRKIKQMEAEVKMRYDEWNEELERAKMERDKAHRESQNYQKMMQEIKSDLEDQLSDASLKAKQEIQRIKTENKKITMEKAAKIFELENEIERTKAGAIQSEQNLYSKIKQLQCAISVCTGSGLMGSVGHLNPGPNPFSSFI